MRSPALAVASSEPTRCSSRRLHSAVLAVITVAAGAARFLYIDRKSFWLDEGVSVEIARLDWSNFLHLLWRREANMTLYYLLLRGWLHWGSSEAFIRALSVLFSIATIPVVYYLGRRLANRRAGLFAAALLSVHAWHVRYAQEARSYSLYTLLVALSSVLFLRKIQGSPSVHERSYIAASVLAVYAHFFGVLAIVAQAASARFFQLSPDVRNRLRRCWKIIAVLLLPLFVFIVSRGMGPIAWIPRPGLAELHRFLLFLTGNGSDILLLAYIILGAIAVCSAPPGERAGIRFLLTWLLLPIVVTLAFSLVRPAFLPRYLVMCTVPLVLLAGIGLTRVRPRWIPAAFLVVTLALSVRGLLAYYRADFDLGREDWRACTRFILEGSRPGDGLLFHSAQARMPFEYYADSLPARARLRVIFPAESSRGLSYRDFLANAKNAPLSSLPGKYEGIWLVLAHNQLSGGEPDGVTTGMETFLRANYGAPVQTRFAGIELLLYTRTPQRK